MHGHWTALVKTNKCQCVWTQRGWRVISVISNYTIKQRSTDDPATSAAMDRAFSEAGYIVSDRRNKLDDDIVEKMFIAKCNSDNFA